LITVVTEFSDFFCTFSPHKVLFITNSSTVLTGEFTVLQLYIRHRMISILWEFNR